MATTLSFEVLIVCTANECRSVHAREVFLKMPLSAKWNIATAGTQALAGSARCDHVVESRSSKAHKSSALTAAAINKADVTLAFEYEQRARCVEKSPASRSKVFLLSEIAALSDLVCRTLRNGGVDAESEFTAVYPKNFKSLTAKQKLTWAIQEIDAARGYVTLDDVEIADAHGSDAQPHEVILPKIEEVIQAFLTNLNDIVTMMNTGAAN